MQNLTDEQLLKKIKLGDETAENEIFNRYKDLVTKISRGYFIVGGDLEDLIQEGMIGLYKAIKSYNETKATTFKTFAILCIKHQIQTAIRQANTQKNKLLSSAISFQNFTSSSTENIDFPIELIFDTTPAEKVINKEDYENLQQNIKSCLSTLEYKVLQLYLQGYSYNEISKRLNISPKSIDNSLTRIKTKLKTKLKEQK